MEPRRIEDLEAESRLVFQRREWLVQRVGWCALALFLLAALAGLFGDGPVSAAQAGQPGDPLWVEYDRFVRRDAPVRLRLHVGPNAAEGRELRIRIERRYLESMRVEHVTPQPERVELTSDYFTYVFSVPDAAGPSSVTFEVEPSLPWRHSGSIALADGASVRIAHFAYF